MTCSPAVAFWPAASLVVQSEPVQVIDAFGTTMHLMPHELAIEVTFGSFHETDQADTDRSAVMSRLATYPPFQELESRHTAVMAAPDVGMGVGVGLAVGDAVEIGRASCRERV